MLGFGMNSMQESAEDYRRAILSIIRTIRKECPDCEFVLVSPMIPNPEIKGFQNNQLPAQQDVLYQIAAELEGVCIAPVHSVFREMTARGKHYLELTGNCINHPNDFSVRVYAQTVCGHWAWMGATDKAKRNAAGTRKNCAAVNKE